MACSGVCGAMISSIRATDHLLHHLHDHSQDVRHRDTLSCRDIDTVQAQSVRNFKHWLLSETHPLSTASTISKVGVRDCGAAFHRSPGSALLDSSLRSHLAHLDEIFKI